jgi:hypothetical protein
LGKLLRACAWAETTLALSWVKYRPSSVEADQKTLTLKVWQDGKFYTFRGCKGTVKGSWKANEICFLSFDFKGVLETHADGAPVIPTGIETTLPPTLLSARAGLWEFHEDNIELGSGVAGAADVLRDGAAFNLQLAVTFTPSATWQARRARVYIDRVGAPTAASTIWATINADAVGDPGAILFTSDVIQANKIDVNAGYVDFLFPTLVTPLTAATPYWLVLDGNYAVAPANAIEWSTVVCLAPAQRSKFFDAAWAATALKNYRYELLGGVKADLLLSDLEINDGNAITERPDWNDAEGWSYPLITNHNFVIGITPEEELNAVRDFFQYHRSSTPLYFGMRIGNTVGNIIDLYSPNVTVGKAGDWGDKGGITTHVIELVCQETLYSSSADEMVITFW